MPRVCEEVSECIRFVVRRSEDCKDLRSACQLMKLDTRIRTSVKHHIEGPTREGWLESVLLLDLVSTESDAQL